MTVFASLCDLLLQAGSSSRFAGQWRSTRVIGALAISVAYGSAIGQTVTASLPDGPLPQAGAGLGPGDERPAGDAFQSTSAAPQNSPSERTQQPSPIAPSRVNPGSKAAQGPLTQAERTQYVVRQLLAPEHVFGYSASALFRMASPPGHGSTYYPSQWRVGGPGFGRNFGDAAAADQTKHVGKYVSGAVLREDPRYYPSVSSNLAMRARDAILFTLVDRSNDGARRPALSNLVGAAAGGYVGDAYLPPGFRNQAHATQRSLVNLAGFAGENVAAEFKPEIRQALLKLHLGFVRP